MDNRENDPWHTAINAKLGEIASASSPPPNWYEAWLRLGSESSEEHRLAVYRAVRDAGSVPEDAAFFLVSWQIDAITLLDAEEALQPYEQRIAVLRQKYGLDKEEPPQPGEGPPDYEEAQDQLYDAWDALYAAKLEDLGEPDMARLFRADQAEFGRRSEAGRQFFHGPDDDDEETDWLDQLLAAVVACVEAHSAMGPLGMRYREEEGFWEVWVYPTPVELVGGRHDGEIVVPGFTLDLEQLRAAFDSVAAFGWNSLGLNSDEGPCVSIEGHFQGREIFLQVLAHFPEGEEPGLKLDTTRGHEEKD